MLSKLGKLSTEPARYIVELESLNTFLGDLNGGLVHLIHQQMADLDTKKTAMRPRLNSPGYGLLESGASEDEVFERKDGDHAGISAFWLKCACCTWNARGASVGRLQVQRPVAIDIALCGLGTNRMSYHFLADSYPV
jgi:hypothetical protein